MKNDKIILGIDPGTNIMGYGAIHIIDKKVKLLGAGIISLEKIKDHPLKMKRIFEGTSELLEQFKPDELSIEAPFFGKNVQSMLKLGRAQGIAIAAALVRSIPIFEYSPKKIKQSVTGNGNSSKEQVAAMLQKLLLIKSLPHYLDATDALGAAMCHYFSSRELIISNLNRTSPASRNASAPPSKGEKQPKNFSGWESFLSENPNRQLRATKKSR